MKAENFGPVMRIMKARDNAEAVRLQLPFWTQDASEAHRIGRELETGTLFMNRCDYLDP